MRVALRFDGSSRHARGEGRGPGGGGAVISDLSSGAILWAGCKHLPNCTVNEGEWCGLTLGLKAVERLQADTVDLRGDSKLVINQLTGKWRINKEAFRTSLATCREILAGRTIEVLDHVARECNTAADAMANLAADGRTMEAWSGGSPPSHDANAPALLGDTPDVATCLLGILPISNAVSINGPTDWFQIMRLSVLDHLNRARSTARISGAQTSTS